MKRVIHIGDGKHVEITEGTIFAPPPPPPPPKRPQNRPPNHPNTMPRPVHQPGTKTEKKETVPGYADWLRLRHKQTKGLSPNIGRALGQSIGMRKKTADRKWKEARRQVKKDMAAIKQSGIELDKAGEEALTTTLTIMRGPGDVRVKLAAARQVLEWSKAKPVSKSEITVNKAEDWLASLAKETDDEDPTGDDS